MKGGINPAAGIEWAVAGRPCPGEQVSGDAHVVAVGPATTLFAVIDGLGHGPGAAHAASIAAHTLHACADFDPASAIERCHEALRGSRGVVLTVVVYVRGEGRLEWAGIGNIESVLWHRPGSHEARRESVASRGGVVGYQLPRLHVASQTVAPGDICCLATDGIAPAFVEKSPAFTKPRHLAEHVLARYARDNDDALVLAVRFAEEGGE